jgi:hypothetical protein
MKIFLILIFTVIVLGFGGCVYGLSKVNGWISKSEPSQALIGELERNVAITSAVGRPIELKLLGGSIRVKTHVSNSNIAGSASYKTTAYGPNGSVPFEADLSLKANVWIIDRLKVNVNDSWKVIK